MAVQVLSGKVFLVVTGASRGIGKQMAETFGHLLDKRSVILLLARNLEGLKEAASKIPKHLEVHCESIDLSVPNADVFKGLLEKCVGSDGVERFDRAVIVHNAGTCGDLSKTTMDMSNVDELRNYFDLNITSPLVLNSVFMKMFNEKSKVDRLVINVTSAAGIEPIPSLGFYGVGKAAREMYFKIFALEFPQVNVLSYSTGPVETDMFDTLVTTSGDDGVRSKFLRIREQNNVLTTQETVDRLVSVLRDQLYKSGGRDDYCDQLIFHLLDCE